MLGFFYFYSFTYKDKEKGIRFEKRTGDRGKDFALHLKGPVEKGRK